jgi:hypothetical protein
MTTRRPFAPCQATAVAAGRALCWDTGRGTRREKRTLRVCAGSLKGAWPASAVGDFKAFLGPDCQTSIDRHQERLKRRMPWASLHRADISEDSEAH